MKDRKYTKIDRKHLQAFKKRVLDRSLKEEDYELLRNLVDNFGLLKGAVDDDVDDETLERMFRDMFGDEA
jgi:hypothetical protein